jgi:hypothetical protein
MSDRPNPRLPEDPSGIDQPHDVLAADEFAVPARSPRDIPPDPIHSPHDVLAAEEFAIPGSGAGEETSTGFDPRTLLPSLLLFLTIALLVRRHRRQG